MNGTVPTFVDLDQSPDPFGVSHFVPEYTFVTSLLGSEPSQSGPITPLRRGFYFLYPVRAPDPAENSGIIAGRVGERGVSAA